MGSNRYEAVFSASGVDVSKEQIPQCPCINSSCDGTMYLHVVPGRLGIFRNAIVIQDSSTGRRIFASNGIVRSYMKCENCGATVDVQSLALH